MNNIYFKTIYCLSVFSLICFGLIFAINPSKAQTKEKKVDWYDKLHEENVNYEESACSKGLKKSVREYFKTHKLSLTFPICHNTCPIVKCRPIISYPKPAKILGIGGIVSVHMLVDGEGNTMYARILEGHPLLRKSVEQAACQTQFNAHELKRQGVMHFDLNPNSDDIEIPKLANIVWK